MTICDDCKKVTYAPSHYCGGAVRCKTCSNVFSANNWEKRRVSEMRRAEAIISFHQANGDETDCGHSGCTTCCQHDERDHGICLDCGDEEDAGAAIDRAMDSMEDR